MFHYADPTYYWQYDSPEAQQLFNEAKTSIDADQATELFRQAARQISEDSPVDWLALAADLTVSRTNLTGYPINNTASRFDLSGITVAS
jgi:peptide/nickel transport system substrate-binding protein